MLELKDSTLYISMPEGKTNRELLALMKDEFNALEQSFYGKDICINGRITTILAAWLGHKLAHICRSLSFFDPKENAYILTISH